MPLKWHRLISTGQMMVQLLFIPTMENLFKINATGGGLKLIYQTSNGDFISEVAVGENEQTIALITNNSNGYDADLFTINFEGQVQEKILNNVTGAIGGLDHFSDR